MVGNFNLKSVNFMEDLKDLLLGTRLFEKTDNEEVDNEEEKEQRPSTN